MVSTKVAVIARAVFMIGLIFGLCAPAQASASTPEPPAPEAAQALVPLRSAARSGECEVAGNRYLTTVGAGILLPRAYRRGSQAYCWLKEGSGPKYDSDSAVYALQYNLRKCHGQKISLDGKFGRQTRDAVMSVQSKYGLKRDGVYGQKTRNAMRWLDVTGSKGCVKYSTKGYWWA